MPENLGDRAKGALAVVLRRERVAYPGEDIGFVGFVVFVTHGAGF